MNYLLDTHTLIWSVSDSKKLSQSVVGALGDGNNRFLVSAISFWEISLKFSLGKLNISGIVPNELPAAAARSGFELIPLSIDESATYHQLSLTHHKDPFDRMLIWQAIKRNLVLISSDKTVNQYKEAGLKVFW